MCKYFIQAIETEKYGWFWECPNGENCHYRHALPPGFVLKSQKKAIEEVRRRERERAQKEIQNIRNEEVKKLAQSLKEKGNLKVDINVSCLLSGFVIYV